MRLFLHAAKSNPVSGLSISTSETVFEVAAKGHIYAVTATKLRQWIPRQRGTARVSLQPAGGSGLMAIYGPRRA